RVGAFLARSASGLRSPWVCASTSARFTGSFASTACRSITLSPSTTPRRSPSLVSKPMIFMMLTLQLGKGRRNGRGPRRFILDATGRVYTLWHYPRRLRQACAEQRHVDWASAAARADARACSIARVIRLGRPSFRAEKGNQHRFQALCLYQAKEPFMFTIPGEIRAPAVLMAALFVGTALVGGSVLAEGGGRWSKGAAMPTERTEVAGAEMAGKIYVVGGLGGQRELEIYDPALDSWSRGGAFPRAVHHAAAVGLNGKLYVIGGYVHEWAPTNAGFEYDPAKEDWRLGAGLPTPRGALAAAVLDGKIHAIGGVGPTKTNTPAHEVYDPTTDKWTPRAPLPTPRDHHAVAALDGRLYAIGGRVNGSYEKNLAASEVYDPGADKWQSRSNLPTARSGIAAAVLGGRIIVVGGEAPSGTFNQVEAFDPKSNGWSTLAPMPTARHGLGAAVVGGKMYVISGGPKPGDTSSTANEIFTP